MILISASLKFIFIYLWKYKKDTIIFIILINMKRFDSNFILGQLSIVLFVYMVYSYEFSNQDNPYEV